MGILKKIFWRYSKVVYLLSFDRDKTADIVVFRSEKYSDHLATILIGFIFIYN